MAGDYPEGRGRVAIEAARIPIEGVSIAGHESFYKLPGFRTLLEFGRAPEDILGFSTVCVSHGHLDHMAGLAHYASRRRLARLPTARVFVPAEVTPLVAQWVEACEKLEHIDYEIELVAAAPGDRIRLRNDLELTVLPGRHRVPTVGYLFSEVKQKLKDEFLAEERGRDRRPAGRGRRGHAPRGGPAARLPGRLRVRDLRRVPGDPPRARSVARVLVPPARGQGPRARVRAHPPRRHPGTGGSVRKRGDSSSRTFRSATGPRRSTRPSPRSRRPLSASRDPVPAGAMIEALWGS